MIKAAVVKTVKTNIPSMLSMFIKPKIIKEINFSIESDSFCFLVIELPTNSDIISRKIIKKIEEICKMNAISKLYIDTMGIKLQSPINVNLVTSEQIANIKSIKVLSSLIKVGEVIEQNKLKSNIGFIVENIEVHMLNTLSNDASSITIYESHYIDKKQQEKIYEEMMNEKGISTVFTKDIYKIIDHSEVIITDEKINLEAYKNNLKGKILLGTNSFEGHFLNIEEIWMWCCDIETSEDKEIIRQFNDEFLCLLREYYGKEKTMDFIKRLQYIYLFDSNGKPIDNIIALK